MGRKVSQSISDQTGRIALVTGANSGLGQETARALAAAGAHVILACRDPDKGEAAARAIRDDQPQADLRVMTLDLADLQSIRAFAADFARAYERLDRLVNNAGVMALPERRTVDGFEMQIGTNHLGHFALTGLLLGYLDVAPGARVVTLSSLAHRFGRIDIGDLNWRDRRYRKWPAYGQSKLANLMFALELDRRLAAAGGGERTLSVAAHPGYAATQLQLAGPRMQGSRLGTLSMRLANTLIGQSPARGALPTLYAATADDVRGGDYFGPDGAGELRGEPTRAAVSRRARNRDTAVQLWALSEQLTGVRYAF